MRTWQWILGGIFVALALLLAVYVSFAARKKGPIFSNTYLWLSEKERENVDKSAEYRLVTVVFSLLAVFCILEAAYIFSQNGWVLAAAFVILGIDAVYAVIDAVRRQ